MTLSRPSGEEQPADSIVFSALLPHPPIVVPAVGRSRVEGCRATLDACRELARRVVAKGPDRIVLPSPHAPRRRDAFGIHAGDRLAGDLARFGAQDAAIDLPSDLEMASALGQEVRREALSTALLPTDEPLDHGACVPLIFLAEAGWEGPTCLVGLPWIRTPQVYESFGHACARAADRLDGRTAFIASGDMSHRVLPDAPAGFHPRAVEFDRQLVDLVRQGRLREIRDLDPKLRELAAEDAVDTSIMACAAAGYRNRGHEVLSYEHPFGVGYLVAVFFDAT